MSASFFNAHSHRKPQNAEEFACRNAFHFLSPETLKELPYPVSVGVHPWHAAQFKEAVLENLRKCVSLPNVLAIGECGLDRSNGPTLEIQMSSWENQFRLAQESGLPLIVHCVKAWQDIFPLVSQSGVPVLLHDFRGNETIQKQFLKLPHVYFSFGKSLLTSHTAQAIFSLVPGDRFLLETDSAAISITSVYEKAESLSTVQGRFFSDSVKKNALAFFGEKALAFF
jgi:TatD DNase family protein